MPEVVAPRPKIPEYVPLHIHSHYSFLSRVGAISSPHKLAAGLARRGIDTYVQTDSNFFGLGKQFHSAETMGLKPIPGIELPIDTQLEQFPLQATFLAKNDAGLRTLFTWETDIAANHRYGVPLIEVEHHQDNIFAFFRGKIDLVMDLLGYENMFLAVDDPTEQTLRRAIRNENQTHKTVITHEIRMAEVEEQKSLETLVRLFPQENPDFDLHRLPQYSLQQPINIWAQYGKYLPAALERTRTIANSTHIEKPQPPLIHPRSVPENIEPYIFLDQLVKQALEKQKRILPSAEFTSLQKRINYELGIIFGRSEFVDFSAYILLCKEVSDYCTKHAMPFLTTGSGNNSATLALLGITQLSPSQANKLLFERFLNAYRQDYPDIDFELPYQKIHEVIDHVLSPYPERVRLAVVNRFRARSLAELLEKSRQSISSETFAALLAAEIPSHVSMHPTGEVFAGDIPLYETGRNIVAEMDTMDAEKIFRFPKIDLINSIGLGWEQYIKGLIGEKAEDIPENDPRALARIFSSDTIGIPGIETPHAQNVLRSIRQYVSRPTKEHIAVALALMRPAVQGRKVFLENLEKGTSPLQEYPQLTAILGHTNFTLLYQDQVLQIGELAGLTSQEQDTLRKILGEKDAPVSDHSELLQKVRAGLSDMFPPTITNQLMGQLTNFVSYGFVEGHAKSLANLAYRMAYYAEYFPKEFWTGVLMSQEERPHTGVYSLQGYLNAAHRHGMRFAFSPLESLAQTLNIWDDRIVVGKQLMAASHKGILQADFGNIYSHWRNLWAGWKKGNVPTREIIAYQLANFGVSITHNPIDMFEQNPFDSQQDVQTIIGQSINRPREYGNNVFITLDTGVQIIQTVIPKYLLPQEDVSNAFFTVEIRRSSVNPNTWNVLSIEPFTV